MEGYVIFTYHCFEVDLLQIVLSYQLVQLVRARNAFNQSGAHQIIKNAMYE
jgi:hypothetical protein